jgi:transcription antitermination factor NusG
MSSVLSNVFTEEGRAPVALYAEPHWFACYTRGRAEKQVERQLQRRGIESFLPLIPRKRQWKDRLKLVDWPLFPSYVFGRFALSDLHAVLTTPGVATVVRTRGYPTPVLETELENVRLFAARLSESGQEAGPPVAFERGQPVRVVSGPFQGVEGVVVEQRNRRRVLVGLHAIGQGLEINVKTELLEPIGLREAADLR